MILMRAAIPSAVEPAHCERARTRHAVDGGRPSVIVITLAREDERVSFSAPASAVPLAASPESSPVPRCWMGRPSGLPQPTSGSDSALEEEETFEEGA